MLFGLAGCANIPSQAGFALIGSTTEPVNATSNTGEKTGQACGRNILGLISSGDFSIEKAKRNAGITQVASVDKDVTNVLFIYSSVCTVVTGK